MVKKNECYTVVAEDNGFSGEGIVKIDNFTVFVPYLIKGEKAEIKILKVLKDYAFGKIEKLIEKSPLRCEEKCPSFKRCGGCDFLHIDYKAQLEIKKNHVIECMRKYCSAEVKVNDVLGMDNPYNYRNKAQYPFEGDVCGFYAQRSHNIIPIDSCLMQNKEDEAILNVIKEYVKKTNASIRHTYIRHGDEGAMVVIVSKSSKLPFTKTLIANLTSAVKNLKSLILNVNPKETNVILGDKNIVLYGDEKINVSIGDVLFEVSPHSFFQVNPIQTKVLYDKAGELLGEKVNHLYDLYCGIGSIGLYLSDKADKITGIEIVESAVEDAKRNAKLNNITNANYLCGASEEILPQLVKKGEKADAVILDPPRKGCSIKLLECLLETEVEKIVYISCNPATLARDLNILAEKYTISPITPVDMFPNTHHVESVVKLTLSTAI